MASVQHLIRLPARLTDGVIVLDEHTSVDAADVAAGEDVEIARRFDGGRPTTARLAQAFIRQYIERREAGGPEVTYALRLPDRTLVGGVEVRRPTAECAEVGYWVYPRFRGHGYALRGLRLLCDAAIGAFEGLVELSALIEPDNPASLRTAEAAGFREAGPVVEHGTKRLRLVRTVAEPPRT
jgi:RimJ/RimL family protein N-acetyltransferase